MFLDYSLDAARLVDATARVAQKCPCLCGRLVSDSQSRYAIQIQPATAESHGFPFTEARADISIAKTILKHTKLKSMPPSFPATPQLPFFMEAIDHSDVIRGKSPLVKIKLTHLRDGCVVNLSVSHMMVDGQRAVELFRDISRAYCGRELHDRCHDRSGMWPDRLVQYYPFLGEKAASLPRTCVSQQKLVGFPKSNNEQVETDVLVFSKDVLEALKRQVTLILPDGEFVSTNDVLLAFLWMLRAEISAKNTVKNSNDLHVGSVTAFTVIECLKAEMPAVPANYFGNAVLTSVLPLDERELERKSLAEVLAHLARVSRGTVRASKEQPCVQAETLLSYYQQLNCSEFRKSDSGPTFALSNLLKTPLQNIDFGQGRPVFAHTTLLMPLYGTLAFAGPGPKDHDGIFIYCEFLKSEFNALEKSIVIQTFAPKMKRLYRDFSTKQINALLGVK